LHVCVFGVLSLVCFELSVPVQVIAWKDLYIMCRAGRKNSTHSHWIRYETVTFQASKLAP